MCMANHVKNAVDLHGRQYLKCSLSISIGIYFHRIKMRGGRRLAEFEVEGFSYRQTACSKYSSVTYKMKYFITLVFYNVF